MAVEVSEESIESFVSITNTTREQAIAYLEANNRDSNRAINAYFENPDGVPTEPEIQWPMPPSSQQGSYAYQNQNVPSFRIDASDTVPSTASYGTAPSRPPSRIGAREQTEEARVGQPIEGPHDKPGPTTGSSQHMTLAEREEQQLQAAMALSLNSELPGDVAMSIGGSDQETGVIGAGNTNFGPATQEHYEDTKWALTTLMGSSHREVIIHPDPEERRRVDDKPVFLRLSNEAEYLAGFITIAHAIPLVREALLLRDKVVDDYGNDSQWWNGQPIVLPHLISVTDDSSVNENASEDILIETQRLMAFLDSSHRAFGSPDPLAGLKAVQAWNTENSVGKFLESWQRAAVSATPNNPLATIFSSLAYKREAKDADLVEKEFFALEVSVESKHHATLYDAVDASIWQDSSGTDFDDIWIENMAEVFVLRLNATGEQKSVNIKIPAVWYPDRYMERFREVSLDLRKRRFEASEEIERLETIIERFSFQAPNTPSSRFKNIFDLAANALQVASKNNVVNGAQADANSADQAMISQGAAQDLADELKDITYQIDQKLKSLEERKQRAIQTLRDTSKQFTNPSDDSAISPHRKYTLRGVCTQPHITYVLRRSSKKEPETAASTSPTPDVWQWWRISFSVDDEKTRVAEAAETPAVSSSQKNSTAGAQTRKRDRVQIPRNTDVAGYTAKPVREIEVLRAAKEEAPSVLLVYANENAVRFEEGLLPPQLQTFVNADNEAFEAEIQEIVGGQAQEPGPREHTSESSNATWPDMEPLGTHTSESWPDMEPLGGRSSESGNQEQGSRAHNSEGSNSSWPEKEPLGGQSSESGSGAAAAVALSKSTNTTTTPQTKRASTGGGPAHKQKHYRSYDDRIPASVRAESAYISPENSDKEPEMQERSGSGILSHGNRPRGAAGTRGAMGQIKEEGIELDGDGTELEGRAREA
ncbi:hypothetical protein FQN52_006204 [Onygenales sp. PD_12]|nr:hypothetical protein FQN52_006204 [Onygenales sp. PD_12]